MAIACGMLLASCGADAYPTSSELPCGSVFALGEERFVPKEATRDVPHLGASAGFGTFGECPKKIELFVIDGVDPNVALAANVREIFVNLKVPDICAVAYTRCVSD